jgi:hypothetical protein
LEISTLLSEKIGTDKKELTIKTLSDRSNSLPGYSTSFWPVECGGNRRQKAASGKLDARNGVAKVTTSHNGRWKVMMIWRAPARYRSAGKASTSP